MTDSSVAVAQHFLAERDGFESDTARESYQIMVK